MTDMESFKALDLKTMGEVIRHVLSIDNHDNAMHFFNGYVEYLEREAGLTAMERKLPPADIARSNIGWCFGEGMSQERVDMWAQCCGAAHPYFGRKLPSGDEAFAIGYRVGMQRKEDQGQGEC